MSEYVVECFRGWGRGPTEEAAMAQMAGQIDPNPGKTLDVMVTECTNFHGGAYGEVDADEIHDEYTREVSNDLLIEIGDLMFDVSRLTDEMMAESEVSDR